MSILYVFYVLFRPLRDPGEIFLRILRCFWLFWPKNLVFYRVWGAAALKNLEFYEGQDVPGPETSYFTGSGRPLGLKTDIFSCFPHLFACFYAFLRPGGSNLALKALI